MTEVQNPLLYSNEVNYREMDPFKIKCQQAAITTAENIERFRESGVIVREITESRGESAYEVQLQILHPMAIRIASVEEGLGSKIVIAKQMRELQAKAEMALKANQVYGRSFHRGIGVDNAAMILNDLATRGASPFVFMLHVAAYPSAFFADEDLTDDLISGTLSACNEVRCAWGGGESPALRDIVNPGHAVLSGSAMGLEFPDNNRPLSEKNLRAGQHIVLLPSSGPHSNGITLLRTPTGVLGTIAKRMMGIDLDSHPERIIDAYIYPLDDGQTYGEAVLAPTILYSRVIDELIAEKAQIQYAIHISGHGWRKLMRAQRNLTYVIDKIPEPQSVFRVIQETSGMTDEQIYGDYNMGAGFALIIEENDVTKVLDIAQRFGHQAIDAGYIEEGPRRVVFTENTGKNVKFEGDDLQIR